MSVDLQLVLQSNTKKPQIHANHPGIRRISAKAAQFVKISKLFEQNASIVSLINSKAEKQEYNSSQTHNLLTEETPRYQSALIKTNQEWKTVQEKNIELEKQISSSIETLNWSINSALKEKSELEISVLTSKHSNDLLSIALQHAEVSRNQYRQILAESEAQYNSIEEKRQDVDEIGQSYIDSTYQEQNLKEERKLHCKKLNNELQEMKGNIRVYCRVKPVLLKEEPVPTIVIQDRQLLIFNKNTPVNLDMVYPDYTTQYEVFEEISELVQSALDGYKVCIFSYGQTGSGKTHTMEGPSGVMNLEAEDHFDQRGMIQRSAEQIFDWIESLRSDGWTVDIWVSWVEIYNEEIRDLLQQGAKLDATRMTQILKTLVPVQNAFEVYGHLQTARKYRAWASTKSNLHSSRSHYVFQMDIRWVRNESVLHGALNLIDLAGSERMKKSEARGMTQKETIKINGSLSTLGRVIEGLVKGNSHVPFRESKLTMMLKEHLIGESKTLMFVNVEQTQESLAETQATLRFAMTVNSCSVGNAKRNLSTRSPCIAK